MKATDFPRRIFVKIEAPETDETYLHAASLADDLAEKGVIPAVAEYKLVRKLKLRTKVEEVR